MTRKLGTIALLLIAVVTVAAPAAAADAAATPPQMVQTYDSLADTILAAKKTEWNLVHTILASTYSHAEGTMKAASAKLAQGGDASAEIEKLAALVAQIGNEGDAAVAAIRKRLVEGGHHHHASGEQQGEYDPGFVIVTREAKKGFLDASKAIARLGGSAKPAALETEWNKVAAQFRALHEGAR